ncbi:MAG TPA: hypothetical protein VHC68_00940 [Candidatus Paceibacterota bacterium]|nr:hypothetical protein [Candidatus Paceibacterota bacterium]
MGTSPNQVNVEYFFRLVYECFTGACTVGGTAGLLAFFAHLWLWITILGYLAAFVGLGFVIYCSMRIFQLRRAEEEKYAPFNLAPEDELANPRFARIQELLAGPSQSQWREAILEADIMLSDALSRKGFGGASIADQLQQLDGRDFASLNDAWEAHRVRNAIAHQGSAFDLSHTLAKRTLDRYERALEEFGAL